MVHKFDLLEAGLYIINYFPGSQHSRYVRHIWSLSVEEQFYLLWPGVLAFCGRRRGLMIAAGFILIAPILRLTYWFFVPAMHDMMNRRFETVADALASAAFSRARRNGWRRGICIIASCVQRYSTWSRS